MAGLELVEQSAGIDSLSNMSNEELVAELNRLEEPLRCRGNLWIQLVPNITQPGSIYKNLILLTFRYFEVPDALDPPSTIQHRTATGFHK